MNIKLQQKYIIKMSGEASEIREVLNNMLKTGKSEKTKGRTKTKKKRKFFSKANLIPLRGKKSREDKVKAWGNASESLFADNDVIWVDEKGNKHTEKLTPQNFKMFFKAINEDQEIELINYGVTEGDDSMIKVVRKLKEKQYGVRVELLEYATGCDEFELMSDIVGATYTDIQSEYDHSTATWYPLEHVYETDNVVGFFYLKHLLTGTPFMDYIDINLEYLTETDQYEAFTEYLNDEDFDPRVVDFIPLFTKVVKSQYEIGGYVSEVLLDRLNSMFCESVLSIEEEYWLDAFPEILDELEKDDYTLTLDEAILGKDKPKHKPFVSYKTRVYEKEA